MFARFNNTPKYEKKYNHVLPSLSGDWLYLCLAGVTMSTWTTHVKISGDVSSHYLKKRAFSHYQQLSSYITLEATGNHDTNIIQ